MLDVGLQAFMGSEILQWLQWLQSCLTHVLFDDAGPRCGGNSFQSTNPASQMQCQLDLIASQFCGTPAHALLVLLVYADLMVCLASRQSPENLTTYNNDDAYCLGSCSVGIPT